MGNAADMFAIYGLRARWASWPSGSFLRKVVSTNAGGARAASVRDLAPLDEGAEMIGSEAGFASSVGEGKSLLTEYFHCALKLDGGDFPKSSRVRVAVSAESLCALAPDGGQIARYGLHTGLVERNALNEWRGSPPKLLGRLLVKRPAWEQKKNSQACNRL
jgi:hypothetical protein